MFRTNTDRAQSSVIGTVLLVAIVVILASLIGIFAMDMYQESTDFETSPTVSFETSQFSVDANTERVVKLAHISGTELTAEETSLRVEAPNGDVTTLNQETESFPETVGAGSSYYIGVQNGDVVVDNDQQFSNLSNNDGVTGLDAGTEISVIWNSADTDTSATLFEYEVEQR